MSKQLLKIIIITYLILGPVNWVPGFSPGFVNSIKYFLFVLMLIPVLRKGELRMLNPLNFNLFLFTIFSCIPAIILSSGNIFYNLVDYILIFLVGIVVVSSPFSRQEWLQIFYKTAIGFSILAVILLIMPYIGLNLKSPEPWLYSSIKLCGLGGYRTGWSNSIFLFVPFLAYLSITVNSRIKQLFFLIAIGVIITLQFNSGGRAGLLCSIISLLVIYRNKKNLFFIFLLAGISVFYLVGEEQISESFRLNKDLIKAKRGTSELDKISSGRIEGYNITWDMIKESPVFGYGFNRSLNLLLNRGMFGDVHNTFIKRWLEGGVLLLFAILTILFKVQSAFRKRIKNLGEYFQSFGTLFVFLPILLANVEPNYLFGSFQGESFYWFVIIALIHKPVSPQKSQYKSNIIGMSASGAPVNINQL